MEQHNTGWLPLHRRIRRVHFVGIGGAGMCGIAEVLLNQGFTVTGSDQLYNASTERLMQLGVDIKEGHAADHVIGADVVVVSTAIASDNPEFEAAYYHRIPVVPRAVMLAEIMRFRYGIAVAGTHGKTTTTSLISSVLAEAGFDPTFVIGGRLNSAGANARLGSGRYLVAEADESDASFLQLYPMLCVVTNIDNDHLETYAGDLQQLRKAFIDFIHHLPFYGVAVMCLDDPIIKAILPEIQRPVVTYGFDSQADIQALDYQQRGAQSFFSVRRRGFDTDLVVGLNLPGKHNVLNALASVAVATEEGVSDAVIVRSLSEFAGIERRFHLCGQWSVAEGTALVIEDYGHHPYEVEMTIAAAREGWPGQRLVMVYQPHRFTRTRDLRSWFVEVLAKVDVLILLPVYSAGEAAIEGASSDDVFACLQQQPSPPEMYLLDDESQLEASLQQVLCAGDVVLLQGAGSIGEIAEELTQRLEKVALSTADPTTVGAVTPLHKVAR